jgi:hypothetical protein
MLLMLPSYSMLTVFEIRYSTATGAESNQKLVTRLANKYALSEIDVRVMMAASDDYIDAFGRIKESKSPCR